jgi:hypothetical protein
LRPNLASLCSEVIQGNISILDYTLPGFYLS